MKEYEWDVWEKHVNQLEIKGWSHITKINTNDSFEKEILKKWVEVVPLFIELVDRRY